MKLSSFVTDTIMQVLQGVVDAQSEWRLTGQKGTINPVWGDYDDGHKALQEISFDVAVTVASSVTGDAKGTIKVVGIVELAGGGERKVDQSAVSRISFKVPVVPPITFIKSGVGETAHS